MATTEVTRAISTAQPSNGRTPLVSVVIPAYRCANTIGQALESVFSQTFIDYEVLVVNDGSPDTVELEQALAPYRAKIEYLKQDNQGPSAARNTGILHARGEYIGLLDSDDFWFPQHLENQIFLLQFDSTIGLVYANGVILENGRPFGRLFDFEPQHGPVTFDAILQEHCTISTSSVVARRQDMLDAGLFDESFRRCEDFDLWLRMRRNGTRMDFQNGVQICHRRANGLASNRDLMRQDRRRVYEKVSRTEALTIDQRAKVASRISLIEAQNKVDQLKQTLINRRYSEALAIAQEASSTRDNWKLRCATTALRTAPGVLRRSYLTYLRVLALRQRAMTARRIKSIQLPPAAWDRDVPGRWTGTGATA